MAAIQFRKEKLSLQTIGVQRFWIGLAAGMIVAVSISLLFNYFREILRSWTGISTDLLLLETKEILFYDYFFCILAAVMGLTISMWIWMSSRNSRNCARRNNSVYKHLARTNALIIFWIVLMVILRIGTLLPMVLFTRPGYDKHLNLFEEYWWLLTLIPIVLFLHNWLAVRLAYRARKWMYISFILCILFGVGLKMTTTVDRDILNNAYLDRYKADYGFIDQEIATATKNYGVVFDKNTIEVLKKWRTEKSVAQIASVKRSFASEKPVSMDTIILQKIIVRNYKQGKSELLSYDRGYNRDAIEHWHYALPKDILKQLSYYPVSSDEAKELAEVLKEQIALVNTPIIDLDKYDNYTHTQIRRSFGARYTMPIELVDQLKNVRAKLLENNHYFSFAKQLPEIVR